MEPLATWDTRTDLLPSRRAARATWLQAHDLPASELYRVEFYLADAPFARLFCYHRNADGRRHFTEAHIQGPHDHDACTAATEPPRDVILSELPPERLLNVTSG